MADAAALDEQAREILRRNDRGGYTVPTEGLYPYQWNWDSMFAAWGWATVDLDRAWREVETLLAGQWPTGMVPHILFHRPDPGYFPGPEVWGTDGMGPMPSSGISQPPVAATFVRKLYERDPAMAEKRIVPVYIRLVAWHEWFLRHRRFMEWIYVTHPWESGRDNAPDWDEGMARLEPGDVGPYQRRDTAHVEASMRPTKEDYDRYIHLVQRGRAARWLDGVIAKQASGTPEPKDDGTLRRRRPGFRVADPMTTFIFVRAHRELLWLGETLGDDTERMGLQLHDFVSGWTERLDRETDPVRTIGAHFPGAGMPRQDHVNFGAFLAWYAGFDHPSLREALAEALEAPFPVPTHPLGHAKFDARRYWRGPTWPVVNSIIAMGLAEQGLRDQAETIRSRTAQLIAEHGFSEYFDPITGDPAGGKAFTWTAAIWLGWASPSAGRG